MKNIYKKQNYLKKNIFKYKNQVKNIVNSKRNI